MSQPLYYFWPDEGPGIENAITDACADGNAKKSSKQTH